MRAILLFAALAFAPLSVLADFTGRVVKVIDGDTLTVLVNKTQIRGGWLCAAKDAVVDDRGRDRYGRTIGRVTCAGVEANSEQIRRGMAWVFVTYAPKGSPLYVLEREARGARRGLWVQPGAVAPWKWRAKKRQAR